MRRRPAYLLLAIVLTGGCVSPAKPTVTSEDFNFTDRAWVQLMIPMDEQLLPALQLAGTRSTSPTIRAQANDLTAAVQRELTELRRLGGLAELPAGNPHAGHKMPGLVDLDTLANLRKSEADSFDALFLTTLRTNLDQTTSLARGEQTNGHQPDTVALATAIEQTRAHYLDDLK